MKYCSCCRWSLQLGRSREADSRSRMWKPGAKKNCAALCDWRDVLGFIWLKRYGRIYGKMLSNLSYNVHNCCLTSATMYNWLCCKEDVRAGMRCETFLIVDVDTSCEGSVEAKKMMPKQAAKGSFTPFAWMCNVRVGIYDFSCQIKAEFNIKGVAE